MKPYVKSNKNDYHDAAAICEAVSRPHMRFVSVKSVEQQDIQALHRIRERLVGERTALVNQIRGLLAEYGIIIPQGVRKVHQVLPRVLEDGENELTTLGREIFSEMHARLRASEMRITEYEQRIGRILRNHPLCQRLVEVEGVGPLISTALVAAVGDARVFKNGRQMGAWLGLVPRQHSSGGKTVLRGISKRGDRYLRTLLIHGARNVVRYADVKHDARSRWLTALKNRRGLNIAAVALANKNARILWALLAGDEAYRKAA